MDELRTSQKARKGEGIYKKMYKNKFIEPDENYIKTKVLITDYTDKIYELLQYALRERLKKKKITYNDINNIKDYCNQIINFDLITMPIQNAVKKIVSDYEYLYCTENYDYYLNNISEISSNVYDYIDVEDIEFDIITSLTQRKFTKEDIKKIRIIIEDKEKVLDSKLKKIFNKIKI